MGDRNVEKLIRKYVDKRDDKLVDIVGRCIRKGYDYEKMKDRVSDHIRDSTARKRLIDALSDAFPQFARRRKHRVCFLACCKSFFYSKYACEFYNFIYLHHLRSK